MQKDVAELLVGNILSLGKDLNKLSEISMHIEDDQERKIFRKHLGQIMASLNMDLLMPIITQYPALDPDK